MQHHELLSRDSAAGAPGRVLFANYLGKYSLQTNYYRRGQSQSQSGVQLNQPKRPHARKASAATVWCIYTPDSSICSHLFIPSGRQRSGAQPSHKTPGFSHPPSYAALFSAMPLPRLAETEPSPLAYSPPSSINTFSDCGCSLPIHVSASSASTSW